MGRVAPGQAGWLRVCLGALGGALMRPRMMILASVGTLLLLSGVAPAAQAGNAPDRCEWTQWSMNAMHTAQICGRGPSNPRLISRIVVDPFAAQEVAEVSAIPVHYPVPLVDNDGNVFALKKGGTYVSCDPPGSGQ